MLSHVGLSYCTGGDATYAVATGRISVFAEPSTETKAAGKKGGEWVYATHDLADGQDVLKSIQERMITGTCNACHGNVITCHVDCRCEAL